jgi:hypothetical protein
MRTFYALRSLRSLKRSSVDGANQDYWQAGRSVASIDSIVSASAIVQEFALAFNQREPAASPPSALSSGPAVVQPAGHPPVHEQFEARAHLSAELSAELSDGVM